MNSPARRRDAAPIRMTDTATSDAFASSRDGRATRANQEKPWDAKPRGYHAPTRVTPVELPNRQLGGLPWEGRNRP